MYQALILTGYEYERCLEPLNDFIFHSFDECALNVIKHASKKYRIFSTEAFLNFKKNDEDREYEYSDNIIVIKQLFIK